MDKAERQLGEDAALLASLSQGGDEGRRALAQLYLRYFARLQLILRRIDRTLPPYDCEDLAQQVFIELWRNRVAFRGDSSALHYMVRIGTNLLSKHHRSETRRRRREAVAVMTFAIPNSENDDKVLHRRETAELVRLALEQLSVDQRTAVDLVYFQHKSTTEAAEILGCSTVALIGRIKRGKHILLHQLRDVLQ